MIRNWLPTMSICSWLSCQDDGGDIQGISIQIEWRGLRAEICIGRGRAA